MDLEVRVGMAMLSSEGPSCPALRCATLFFRIPRDQKMSILRNIQLMFGEVHIASVLA